MSRYGKWERNVPLGRAREGIVEGALAVAFEVEGDIEKANGFEAGVDCGGHVGSESTGEFVASEFVVEADAELMEAEVAQGGFGAINERETFGGHFGAIGDARGEAGGSGAIPSGETRAAGEFADFGFAEADVEERSEDVMLGRGTMARAEVERVVRVDAVGDG